MFIVYLETLTFGKLVLETSTTKNEDKIFISTEHSSLVLDVSKLKDINAPIIKFVLYSNSHKFKMIMGKEEREGLLTKVTNLKVPGGFHLIPHFA